MVTIYVLAFVAITTSGCKHTAHGAGEDIERMGEKSGQNSIAMNKPLGIALLAVGIMLIIFWTQCLRFVWLGRSRFFTGKPTDKTIWLLVGGDSFRGVGFFMWLAAVDARQNRNQLIPPSRMTFALFFGAQRAICNSAEERCF